MILYHFTNAESALSIMRDGRIISLADKKALRPDTHAQPPKFEWDVIVDSLVWLTNHKVARQAWQIMDFKHQVAIEVDVPDAVKWAKFCRDNGIPKWYSDALAYRGTKPSTWYVMSRPVESPEWKRVVLTDEPEAPLFMAGDPLAEATHASEPRLKVKSDEVQDEYRRLIEAGVLKVDPSGRIQV